MTEESKSKEEDSRQDQAPTTRRSRTLERRNTIPIEIGVVEECTINEAEAKYFPPPDDSTAESVSHAAKTELLKLPKEARNILAGGIAGIAAKSLVAPVDRIKIMYQISNAHFHVTDIPRVALRIIKSEGLAALWRGNTATMIRVFPYSGVQFMVYDRCKLYFLHKHANERNEQVERKYGLSPVESLVSGMIAGCVSVVCTYPLDLTRAQLAVIRTTADRKHDLVSVLFDNYRQRGLFGLFRGISPTLIGILPYAGIAFALNEQGKRQIQHLMKREVTTFERMQCGAFSGLVAQSVSYPLEVIRRRMQTIGLVGTHNDSALASLGVTDKRPVFATPPTLISTVRDLYKEQGVRGFVKGVSMNWMKGPIAFSISFTTFDLVQKFMESPAERAERLPQYNLSTSSATTTSRKAS